MGIAAERVAMAAVPVEQAVQPYLMLRNHAVPAELGENASADFAPHGVLAAAVQDVSMSDSDVCSTAL